MLASQSLVVLSAVLLLRGRGALSGEEEDWTDFIQSNPGVNLMVDIILMKLSSEILKSNRTEIPLNDLYKRFSSKSQHPLLEGGFTATDGYMGNISNMYRIGDAKLVQNKGVFTLSASFKINFLDFWYKHCNMSFLGLKQHGMIVGLVANTSVLLQANIQHPLDNKTCKVTLNDLHVEDFKDFSIDLPGFWIVDSLRKNITLWIANEASRTFRDHTAKTTLPQLSRVLQGMDLCSLFQ